MNFISLWESVVCESWSQKPLILANVHPSKVTIITYVNGMFEGSPQT